MSELVILIPYYNNGIELEETVKSISENICIDLLIVDDGSTVKPNIDSVKKSYKNQGKIFFEILETNLGIEGALNHGLKFIENSEYKYIGRLDAGDFVLEGKFEKQLNHLKANPDIYLLGTWANVVDQKMNHLYHLKHPTHYHAIKKKMYLNSCFVHPSVVYRREVLSSIGLYPENRKSAEDYAYFFKIIRIYKAENLPEILINYVINENSISSLKRKQQIKSRIRIILDNFYIGIYPIFGIIKNSILLFTSREFVSSIKKNMNFL